jgi:undecaprenyl-diphosphatase
VITGIGGLLLEALDFELPESPTPVGIALVAGGALFLILERVVKRHSRETITWTMAVAIGLAQLVAAVFPGTSRSGATILIALAMGLSRAVAVEFTFLLGVPTLLAAGALKLFSSLRAGGADLDLGMLALGTVVSAATAFLAVRWLLRYVQTHTFDAFGWYRLVVGAAVLLPVILR